MIRLVKSTEERGVSRLRAQMEGQEESMKRAECFLSHYIITFGRMGAEVDLLHSKPQDDVGNS